MNDRSEQKELLDLKTYTKEEYEGCLKQLGRIGRVLGAQKAVLSRIKKLSPQSILDVGCGGGDFTAKLALTFPDTTVVGTDIDEESIVYAKSHFGSISNLSFATRPLSFEEDNSFDIVTSTLVCHHLSKEELPPFLEKGKRVAKKALLCNDLHRCPVAYALFAIVSFLFFRNRLIRHDGLVSIKRAFQRDELQKALPCATITWHWPFRWILLCKK